MVPIKEIGRYPFRKFGKEVLNHKLMIKELSILTSKSYRQCQRLVKKVKDKGMLGVIHGNFGKEPHNKTSLHDELDIKNLLKNDYYDFNLTHFKEMILDAEFPQSVPPEFPPICTA